MSARLCIGVLANFFQQIPQKFCRIQNDVQRKLFIEYLDPAKPIAMHCGRDCTVDVCEDVDGGIDCDRDASQQGSAPMALNAPEAAENKNRYFLVGNHCVRMINIAQEMHAAHSCDGTYWTVM